MGSWSLLKGLAGSFILGNVAEPLIPGVVHPSEGGPRTHIILTGEEHQDGGQQVAPRTHTPINGPLHGRPVRLHRIRILIAVKPLPGTLALALQIHTQIVAGHLRGILAAGHLIHMLREVGRHLVGILVVALQTLAQEDWVVGAPRIRAATAVGVRLPIREIPVKHLILTAGAIPPPDMITTPPDG